MTAVRALLITDVVDSTHLAQTLGDAAAADLWAAHDRAARDLLSVWRGREIDKSDGMLLLFDAAADALGFARAYHRALAALPMPLRARAGLHVGPVILRRNDAADVARGAKPLDVEGLAKPTAARVMSLARGGQILLTTQARAALGDAPERVRSHGHWLLKGMTEPVEVFEAGDDETVFAAPADTDKAHRVARVGQRWLPTRQVPNNLPQQLTSFVGRGAVIDEVKDALGRSRLVTLSGSGGCGKTRLAQQVATELLADFPDGVWQVELAALSEPGLVPQAVATVLGVKEELGRTLMHSLTEHLESRQLLVVLDNAEHLLGACAQLAEALPRLCPHVKILVSSREALGIRGELVYRVPSLTLADGSRDASPEDVARAESVHLFVDRARSHSPHFSVDGGNAAAVASICRRLDGIPLAIELAAARLRTVSVDELSARLDQRFRLLTGGSRTALPRQQTLRALVDWSHDLLRPTEQILLRRLSVFAGGWTLAAAEAVCGVEDVASDDVLDLLTALIDKSLVQADERGSEMRYRLLETMRQYARDRLMESGEATQLRDRHLARFLALAEEAGQHLSSADQGRWLDRLEVEHDNLRAALTWSASEGGATANGLRLAGALAPFWSVRGHPSEGRGWLTALLATAPAAAAAIRARALGGAGRLAREQGDYNEAHSLLSEQLALHRQMDDRLGLAATLNQLAMVARERSDYRAAGVLLQESLAIWHQIGDRPGIAAALNGLGNAAREAGDHAAAQSYFEQSLAIDRAIGDRLAIAISLNNLGGVANDRGDFEAARALHEQSLAIRRELGDRRGIASSLTNLAAVMLVLRERDAAWGLLEEGLAIRRELGDRRGIAVSLGELGNVATSRGDLLAARSLHKQSLGIRRELGDQWGIATSLNYLGGIACAFDEPQAALAHFAESLTLARAIGDRWGIAESLQGLADVAASSSRPARAVRLWSAAQGLRDAIGAPLRPQERDERDARLVLARAAIGGDADFDRAWREGAAMTVEQAIDHALSIEDAH